MKRDTTRHNATGYATPLFFLGLALFGSILLYHVLVNVIRLQGLTNILTR